MTLDLQHIERTALILAENDNIAIEDAEKLLAKSQIILEASEKLSTSYPLQVAFLTCYNAGNRIFKGGVITKIPQNIPNLLPFKGTTFNEVLNNLFPFKEEEHIEESVPKIVFGKVPSSSNEIELICTGWQGGINFFNSETIYLENNSTQVPLGACLASAYALFWTFNTSFAIVKDLQSDSFGYSLWNNSLESNWFDDSCEGPSNVYIPPKIWLVGLGHLGQAYLWLLSNFRNKLTCEILLQDYDKLGLENLGAQLLSFKSQIGRKKTQICAAFLENIGIESIVIEKKFGSHDQQDSSLEEFKVLLTGLDNAKVRRDIDPERFCICMDGATNGKLSNFDSFTFRNLKLMKRTPKEIWKDEGVNNEILHENIYRMIEEKGGCGVLTNIGISTPFVGLFGASILISELIKSTNKGELISTFSGKIRTIGSYSI